MSLELSPLQLKHLVFSRIHIEPVQMPDQTEVIWAPVFDFTDVTIRVDISSGVADQETDQPTEFMITVRLAILNEEGKGKPAPYTIDMEAYAWFEISPNFPTTDRESLVRINGSSLIIGSIRDMLQQITARFPFGPMLLPTLRILPEKAGEESQP